MHPHRIGPPDALRPPSGLWRPSVLRRLGLSALWTGCTVITTAAGLTAVHLVGNEVSDRGASAMSPDAVTRAVADLPAVAPNRAVPDLPPELFGQTPPTPSHDGSFGATASPTPSDPPSAKPTSHPGSRQTPQGKPPASPRPTTRPQSTGTPVPTPTAASTGVVHVTGGTVYLRCNDGKVYVRAAYPEDGYHVRPIHGDSNRRWVFVEFDHDGHRDAWQVWARCDRGELQAVSKHVKHGGPSPSPAPSPTPSGTPAPPTPAQTPHGVVASPAAALASTAAEPPTG